MEQVVLDRPITEAEWDKLFDPPGGRYEILDGRLVMNPSPGARHNRVGEDLADLLRIALAKAGLDLPVTIDVEWRTVAADVVVQAPRGDVVVGRGLHPVKDIHVEAPLLVVETWGIDSPASTITSKRNYWRDQGVNHYWELFVGADDQATDLVVWRLGSDELPRRATSAETLAITEPFAIELTPGLILGATQRMYERFTAETEQLAGENETLRQQLRDLGIDP